MREITTCQAVMILKNNPHYGGNHTFPGGRTPPLQCGLFAQNNTSSHAPLTPYCSWKCSAPFQPQVQAKNIRLIVPHWDIMSLNPSDPPAIYNWKLRLTNKFDHAL